MIPASQALLDEVDQVGWAAVFVNRDALAERLALIEAAVGREARAEADATLIVLREVVDSWAWGAWFRDEGDDEDQCIACRAKYTPEKVHGASCPIGSVLSDSDSAAQAAVERIEQEAVKPWRNSVARLKRAAGFARSAAMSAEYLTDDEQGEIQIAIDEARSLLEHNA